MELKYFDNNKYTFDKISCIKDGHFFDPNFKYDDESTLYGLNRKLEEYKKTNEMYYGIYQKRAKEFKSRIRKKGEIKWMRILDPEYDINKEEKNEQNDDDETILQGELGDCYFIAYLYILQKNHNEVFISLIKDYQIKTGYVEIVFYIEENNEIERKIVVVDDFIPFIKKDDGYIPLFAHYRNNKLTKNRVFLLIEKAYAKINGSYFCIEGNKEDHLQYNYMKALTGVEPNEKLFSEFIIDYAKDNKIEYENKDIISIIKDWPIENKIRILEKLNNFAGENSIILSSHKYFGKPRITKNFCGIYYDHIYVYIKGDEQVNRYGKSEIFFWTYNPHGKNEFTDYEFENINEENKKESKNGIIILNFFKFFRSFTKMIYQNRNQVQLNFNNSKYISFLDSCFNFINDKRKIIMEKYKENIDYLFGLLSLFKLYKENEEIKNRILLELFANNNCDKNYYYSNLILLYNLIINQKKTVKEEKILNSNSNINPSSKISSEKKFKCPILFKKPPNIEFKF